MLSVQIGARGASRTTDSFETSRSFVASFGRLVSVESSTKLSESFGGFDVCSVVVEPNGAWVGGLFRPGDPMEIQGNTFWAGEYADTEYNEDNTVTIHGRGIGHDLYNYPCTVFTSVPGQPDIEYPTRVPADGLPHQQDLGLSVHDIVGTVPTNAAGSANGTVSVDVLDIPARTFGDVLSQACREEGKYWMMMGTTLVIFELPTDPIYSMQGSQTRFVGVADDAYFTDIDVMYLRSGSNPATAAPTAHGMGRWVDNAGLELFDRRKAPPVDYRAVVLDGSMSLRQDHADNIAEALGEKVKGRFQISGNVTLTAEDGLTTLTGGKVPLGSVQAGQRVQVKDARTTQGSLLPSGDTTFVIGEARYSFSGDDIESLTISALDPAPRDINQILAPPAVEDGTVQAP